MKKQPLFVTTTYENENSCLEDVLEVANAMKQKTRSTTKSAQTLQSSGSELLRQGIRTKGRIP